MEAIFCVSLRFRRTRCAMCKTQQRRGTRQCRIFCNSFAGIEDAVCSMRRMHGVSLTPAEPTDSQKYVNHMKKSKMEIKIAKREKTPSSLKLNLLR